MYPFQMLNALIRTICILRVVSSEIVAILNICDVNITQTGTGSCLTALLLKRILMN